MSGIRVFNAAMEQFRKNEEHQSIIDSRRQQTEHDKQSMEYEKKIKQNELEKARHEKKMNALDYKIQSDLLTDYFKQKKQIYDGKSAEQEMATIQAEQNKKQAGNIMTVIAKADPNVQAMLTGYSSVSPVRQQSLAGDVISEQDELGRIRPKVSAGGHYRLERDKPTKIKESKDYVLSELAMKMYKDLDIENSDTEGMSFDEKMDFYKKKASKMFSGTINEEQADNTKIKVRTPDGTIGYIPRTKLKEAKQRGFTEVR